MRSPRAIHANFKWDANIAKPSAHHRPQLYAAPVDRKSNEKLHGAWQTRSPQTSQPRNHGFSHRLNSHVKGFFSVHESTSFFSSYSPLLPPGFSMSFEKNLRWVAVDDSDSAITYTGSWRISEDQFGQYNRFGPPHDGSQHVTTTTGSFSFPFEGASYLLVILASEEN